MSGEASSSSSGMLTEREVLQLQRSLQSRSVRELAFTVCSIRNLREEVKCIHNDLFSSFPPAQAAHTSASLPRRTSNLQPTLSLINRRPVVARRKIRKDRRSFYCLKCRLPFSSRTSYSSHMINRHGSSLTQNNGTTSTQQPSETTQQEKTIPNSTDEVVVLISAANDEEKQSEAEENDKNSQPDEMGVKMESVEVFPTNKDSDDLLSSVNDQIVNAPSDDGFLQLSPDMQIDEMLSGMSQSARTESAPRKVYAKPQYSPLDRDLQNAISQHVNNLPSAHTFDCSQLNCKFTTPSREKLRAHLLKHRGLNPYYCDSCPYSCKTPALLRRHTSIHTSVKPYQCTECGFGSVHHVELAKHMLGRHPGVEPYACPHCPYRAITPTVLKKHRCGQETM